MKKYKTKIVKEEIQVLETVTCDRCGKSYKPGDYESQDDEFLSVDFVGGYYSFFGDMNHVRCDLCHKCLNELIGKFCRVEPYDS